MTDDRLSEIEARTEAATPGPWKRSGSLVEDKHGNRMVQTWGLAWMQHAEFIAHAREDVPYLIARVRDARLPFDALSCVAHGWPVLGLMASRHFRTPVIPAYWQDSVESSS